MLALDVEVDYGRLKSPLILEAEVLPGPESYLPEMSCVMQTPANYPGGYPPRSIKAAQIGVGPGRYRWPRHGVPFNSRNERSQCVG
jgi:hypothetical protein